MHNLFLGELRHHCRDVWGLDVKDKASDSTKVPLHTPEQQSAQLLRVLKVLQAQSSSALDKIRRGYIVAVAEFNGVVPTMSLTKKAYRTALLDWVKTHDGPIKIPPVLAEATTDFHLAQGPHDISQFRVLDQATVDRVRKDISATHFPSWMERPPRNFGSPAHGKLKADQWRTVCTVSLVITLCRLWGSSNTPDKYKLLLDNFLALVCAVDLATRRSMDAEHIEKFDRYMMHYLETLRSLFNHQLVPNHHLSLHLRQCLLIFGPVHAWWAFPFERYNGLLQHLNTNSKTDKMPLTFIRYFYIGSGLRWLINTVVWPNSAPFKKMMSAYNEAVASVKMAGVRAADFMPFGCESQGVASNYAQDYDDTQELELPRRPYDSLLALVSSNTLHAFSSAFEGSVQSMPILSSRVHPIRSIDRDGVTFASRKSGLRNSFVLFDDPTRSAGYSTPLAGQIVDIFLHARREGAELIVEPFFQIDEYRPLSSSHDTHDPYRRFPDIETWLCYNAFHSSPGVVRLQDIRCHFAALTYTPNDIGTECIVVRSLDRVSTFWHTMGACCKG
ncbi:hypothetical protein LXA43DRAFT_898720 [Ganoderma leucocontextum]|nr:hypothetical protein LXA43DRAFT_898720 [Ganoderma leucocontextum]